MRTTIALAVTVALWAAPALASHIVPQTFANTPADPPATTASPTAPAHQSPSVFPFYTPMPAGPAQAASADNASTGDRLNPQMNPHDIKNPHR